MPHSGTVVFCFPLVMFDPGVGASVVEDEDRIFERTDLGISRTLHPVSRPPSTPPLGPDSAGRDRDSGASAPANAREGGTRQTRLILASIDSSIDSSGRCLFTFFLLFFYRLSLFPSIEFPNYCGPCSSSAQIPGSPSLRSRLPRPRPDLSPHRIGNFPRAAPQPQPRRSRRPRHTKHGDPRRRPQKGAVGPQRQRRQRRGPRDRVPPRPPGPPERRGRRGAGRVQGAPRGEGAVYAGAAGV